MVHAVSAPLTEGDPRRVGPYTTVGRLGAGALGVLYAGRSEDGGLAAVRALRPEPLADADLRARLASDIAAARTVPGPYAARILGADLEAAEPWLAAEFVPGLPLAQAVAGHGPLPEPALLTLAAGVAEALAALHAAGVMHGDLRPGTVLLTAEGPRVVDHALARAYDGVAELGVPGFLAPEQAKNRPVTPAADMFALGSTLFYAAMGRAPFGEGTPAEVKERVAKSSPVLGKLPASLAELVRGCFQKDPNNRAQPQQVLEYVRRRAPLPLGSGWLPPGVAAAVREVGAEFGEAGAGSGSDAHATLVIPPRDGGVGAGAGAGAGGLGQPALAPVGASALAQPGVMAVGAAQPGSSPGGFGAAPQQGDPAVAFGAGSFGPAQPVAVRVGAPKATSRRNLLLALTGGAVVVVGGGAAVAVGVGSDSSGTTPGVADAAPPSTAVVPSTSALPSTAGQSAPGLGAPSSPSASPSPQQRPLPPAGPLPQPRGAVGALQAPGARAFWTVPGVGAVTSLAFGAGVLVVCGESDVSGYDLGGNRVWGPVRAAGVRGSGNGVVASGAVHLVVAGAGGGSDLLALDLKSGAEKWRTALPPGAGPGDARVGGALGRLVFVVGALASTPFLWAVNSADGSTSWQKNGAQFAALAVPPAGTQVLAVGPVAPAATASAVALDVRRGDQAWSRQLGTSVDYRHVSLGRAAFAGAHYLLLAGAKGADSLFAGTAADGKYAWSVKLPEPVGDAGSLALLARTPDANSVVALSRRCLYAVDARSGKVAWTSQSANPLLTASDDGAPQFADGNVYVPDQRGTWWAVDVASGRARWKFGVAGLTPGDVAWIAVPGGLVVSAGGALSLVAAAG